MAADIAAKIQDQTVRLAGGLAGATANHLNIARGGKRRPQQRDEINLRNVEARYEDVSAGQAIDLTAAEGGNSVPPLALRRLSGDGLALDAAGSQCIPHVGGMIDAAAEDEPRNPAP